MIANENQYLVTQRWEREFAELVEHMESDEADTTPAESPVLRKAKLDAAKSTLDELRQELREWEANQSADAANVANAVAQIFADAGPDNRANRRNDEHPTAGAA